PSPGGFCSELRTVRQRKWYPARSSKGTRSLSETAHRWRIVRHLEVRRLGRSADLVAAGAEAVEGVEATRYEQRSRNRSSPAASRRPFPGGEAGQGRRHSPRAHPQDLPHA